MHYLILSEQIGIQKTLQDSRQLRICLQLKQQLHAFGTQGLLHSPEVRLCIEACFKALSIHLSVFAQNVGVNL